MNIQYLTPINYTGISIAARGYIDLLFELGHNIKIVPETEKVIYYSAEDEAKLKPLINNTIDKFDLTIIHSFPSAFDHHQEKLTWDKTTPKLLMFAWEFDKYPENLIAAIMKYANQSVTFAPKQVDYFKDHINNNITYLPHDVKKQEYSKQTWNTPFTFLTVMDWVARKDPLTLLKAFMVEFNEHEDVQLIIKTSGRMDISRIKQITTKMARDYSITKPPKMSFVNSVLSEEDMNNLYKQADCFVSSTHGEGWGLGFTDAISRGIPVIYPDSDLIPNMFFTKENSIGVKTYRSFVNGFEFGQLPHGMTWAQIDEVELAKTMRLVFKNHVSMFNLPVTFADTFTKDQEALKDKFEDLLYKTSGIPRKE